MIDRWSLMTYENPDGWVHEPVSPLLELSLPPFLDGVTARRLGQWDDQKRNFDRYLPGRHQAIGLLLTPHDTELNIDDRLVFKGRSAVGSFVIPPGARIMGRHSGAQDFVQFLFAPHGLAAVLEDMSLDRSRIELRPIYIPADASVEALASRLEFCFDHLPELDSLYFDLLLQSCIGMLIRRHAVIPRGYGRRDESLSLVTARRVTDFIDAELATPLRLVDLAAVAGVSRAHFARAFRNHFGIAPHGYVLQRRIERCLGLLCHTTIPIGAIAMMAGFSDHPHLTRTFQRHLGVSPRALRP